MGSVCTAQIQGSRAPPWSYSTKPGLALWGCTMRHPKHQNLQGLQGWISCDCPWNELRCPRPRAEHTQSPGLSWRFQQSRAEPVSIGTVPQGPSGSVCMAPCLANNPVPHHLMGHSQLWVPCACVQEQPLTRIQELFSLSVHTETFQKLTGA